MTQDVRLTYFDNFFMLKILKIEFTIQNNLVFRRFVEQVYLHSVMGCTYQEANKSTNIKYVNKRTF